MRKLIGVLPAILIIVSALLIRGLWYSTPSTTVPASILQPTAESLLKSPLPAVDFIDYLDPYPGQTGLSSQHFCMSLNPEAIYEPGDYKKDFDNKWRTLFRLTLDGNPISVEQMNFIYNLSCFAATDNRCAKLNMMGCVQEKLLAEGLHSATLQATSMSGKVYSYTWAFRVDSIIPDIDQKGFELEFSERLSKGVTADPFVASWATAMPYLVKTLTPVGTP
jgi:hypothetical protein